METLSVRVRPDVSILFFSISVVWCLPAWYLTAAELGEPNAQFSVSVMYYKGQGLPKNRVEAAKWWTVAMSHGPEWDKRFRPSVESAEAKLTAEENVEGQRRATEWLTAHEAKK